HFQVRKDAERPFLVSTPSVAVRAVGTAFSVRVGAEELEVLVTEGRVAVDRRTDTNSATMPRTSAPTEAPLAYVSAGERAVIDGADAAAITTAAVAPIDHTELSEKLSWRVPRLEFSGTPLRDAVAMFNRHSAVHIEL